MDLALVSANTNQLRYVMDIGDKHPYYYTSIGLILTSLVMQLIVGLALLYNSRYGTPPLCYIPFTGSCNTSFLSLSVIFWGLLNHAIFSWFLFLDSTFENGKRCSQPIGSTISPWSGCFWSRSSTCSSRRSTGQTRGHTPARWSQCRPMSPARCRRRRRRM